ncbi:serine hydrolase domain-containing protein [Actinopolymorpha rutila]|uniref:CubicO group peptidase (Beta-lactamase class C family) n=1 Tax=Actinopolymorpha rutila TaxID=446787 RepID=A0A852ZDG1_9ACTN|nr:serine hydrolase domain-containing protein [Actinopolymorpha rutila]NYH91191.1 CubicO group peptidase (beta-lactamase class C family) [Actinopolymorpha rutila]
MTPLTSQRWQETLDRLCRVHSVPGASLAVLADGEVHTVAAGVVNTGTGVETTADAVFQLGSLSKLYTTTLVAGLVQDGRLTAHTRIRDILPEFRLATQGAADAITVRQILSHTSGLDGDFYRDTGRGDDCLARYVEECAELDLVHPPGTAMSYSNAGYSLLGRVAERVTGLTWDTALSRRVLDPLRVTHTGTLPEGMLRHRAAVGHEDSPRTPVDRLVLPRSTGPAGGVWASAADMLGLVRLHLRDPSLAWLREPHAEVPDEGRPIRRALGWIQYDWDGREVFGHDGEAIGQYAFLRVVPDRQVAVALLTNAYSVPLYLELFTTLLAELADLAVPRFTVPVPSPEIDITPWVGTYRNLTREATIESRGGQPWVTMRFANELVTAGFTQQIRLTPVSKTLFADRTDGYPRSWTFRHLPDGRPYLHLGGRLLPRVSD